MDTDLLHFTIDDYLKRYSNALTHLSRCAPTKTFDDVLSYVKKHKLHKEAMQLYDDQRDCYDVCIPQIEANVGYYG